MEKKKLTQQQEENEAIMGSSANNAVETISDSKKWEKTKNDKNKDVGFRLTTK